MTTSCVQQVIYYWDARDGESRRGWWIGLQSDENIVFAYNPDACFTPLSNSLANLTSRLAFRDCPNALVKSDMFPDTRADASHCSIPELVSVFFVQVGKSWRPSSR